MQSMLSSYMADALRADATRHDLHVAPRRGAGSLLSRLLRRA